MLKTAAKTEATDAQQELTDGFHLVIDALKLNDLTTIYGVPGIPITDLGRMAQAEGIRVISFRHEQNAGNAAAIAGFLTKKPGVCLTVSAPGFLNGLTALANATTNCFPMILISGSSEREIVDLHQGAYEQMDQPPIPLPLMVLTKGLWPDPNPEGGGAARSTVLKDAAGVRLIGARLNWLLSHGKGKTWGEAPKKFIQIDIEPKEMDSNVEIVAPVVGDVGSCVSALLEGMSGNWSAAPADWVNTVNKKRDDNVTKMAPNLMSNASPMRDHVALSSLR